MAAIYHQGIAPNGFLARLAYLVAVVWLATVFYASVLLAGLALRGQSTAGLNQILARYVQNLRPYEPYQGYYGARPKNRRK